MPEATLEQRMTALEQAVRELQEAMNARKPASDWLDRVIGSMKDEPTFDEVLAHGRAIRPAEDGPHLIEPLKAGTFVKIRLSGYHRAQIAEYLGPLGPKGARVYRVLVESKPRRVYIEVLEEQLEVLDDK